MWFSDTQKLSSCPFHWDLLVVKVECDPYIFMLGFSGKRQMCEESTVMYAGCFLLLALCLLVIIFHTGCILW